MLRSPVVLVAGLGLATLGCTTPASDGDSANPESGTSTSDASTTGSTTETATSGEPQSCGGSIAVSAPGPGYLYLDGHYTGSSAPRTLELELGSSHEIAVAVDGGAYYAAEVSVEDSLCAVELDEPERVGPTTWRALWIGIPSTEAEVEGQLCQTGASPEELDAAFADFEWSIEQHFGRYSHQTMAWEVVRQDTRAPVTVTGSGEWFDIHPGDVAEVWDMVEPGDFDVIVTVWKSRGQGCTIPGSYFGLGWSPQPETKQSGFVSIKFDTDDIVSTIAWHHENDPGVWIHEWLHTVVEAFYPNLGRPHPAPGGDGLILHGAEDYGYAAPWMSWYEDLIGGRVVEGEGFVGISPAALAACPVRQHALEPCMNFD